MKQIEKRKTPRASWIDYNEGLYFITICTKERKHYLGEIKDSEMILSIIGGFLDNELKNVSLHHSNINIIQYVIMPNHFHFIIDIVGTLRAVSEESERNNITKTRTLLSSYIGSLKSAVTKFAHTCGLEFAWQPRYHDHKIRGVQDGNNISDYIENNVYNWESDCFYGK